ncbi:MAG TPA: hypothetical protein VHV47_01355 [Opitutaceae bacterium]|jgi:hypothetical protein|nr:hypothetical protein [Opitutaceae bacterium]
MNRRIKAFWGLAALAGAGLLFAGCVGEGGGEVDVGADYYGPAYGGPVYYGHPWVHNDVIIGHPPERHFTPRPEAHHEAPHAAPRGGGGGGHDRDHR